VPTPRNVIDLLAALDEPDLLAMREVNRQELARLTVEAQQIEQALTRKSRRNGRGIRSGGGQVTRAQVYELARDAAQPVTAPVVTRLFADRGIDTSVNAVRNHLVRLVDDGKLMRLEDGSYTVDSQDTGFASADHDIPF
jgi:hypothetical protein